MASRPPDFLALLQVLADHGVEFIIVGGVAAIIEGAPLTTLDLDIVVDRNEENLGRLAAALEATHARYRDPAGRHIPADQRRVTTARTNLLLTDLGPLDVLAEIGDSETFEDLLQHCVVRRLQAREFRILGLAKIIETKRFANSDKDRAVLPLLQRTLEERQRS
jgi:hypothetical protein